MCVRAVSSHLKILAWQLATDQIQTIFDANVRQRANERNLYANIFVSTLYFIVFHSAMAGIQIHTVFHLQRIFRPFAASAKTKGNAEKRRIYICESERLNEIKTQQKRGVDEGAFDQNCWHRRIVADLMEIHAPVAQYKHRALSFVSMFFLLLKCCNLSALSKSFCHALSPTTIDTSAEITCVRCVCCL